METTKVGITKSNRPEESRRFTDSEDENALRPTRPPPPDGGYGWVVVVASFFCNVVVDGITYTFGVFLTQFVDYFQEGKGKIAWVGSLLTGMCFIVGPVVGGLCNKFGCRIVSISGSIIACAAFILSTFSPNSIVLMITYGIMGGIGFGLIYLPSVVNVGYYFETRRSLATGIAVCGSGFGTFAFAPLAQFLVETFTWQTANCILAGIIFSCCIFGALMRPLKFPKPDRHKPLLMRMAEDKRIQMQRGSVVDSFITIQLADGSVQKIRKLPINVDPGVHSVLDLDQLTPATPVSPTSPQSLPTITEGRTPHSSTSVSNADLVESSIDVSEPGGKFNFDMNKVNTLHELSRGVDQGLPHVSTQPDFHKAPKTQVDNGSAPVLNNTSSKDGNATDDSVFSTSSINMRTSKDQLRPLVTKDVFYSGSVQNLQEFQSQGSLAAYRKSNISIPQKKHRGKVASFLLSMFDPTLLNDPVFMLIGFSNLFGFAALYVPFVYLVDNAVKDGIDVKDASLLISVIGITNTVGRIVCGWIADFSFINSLLLNNCSLLLASLTVLSIPFCHSYYSYIVMAISYGIAIAVFISLTSIILVDLMGLDRLTNAFGLLMLFRGIAALFGTPIAGMIYDATGTYKYPFYMVSLMFFISTILSFAVSFFKRSAKLEQKPIKMSSLERIEEGNEE